MGGFITTQRLNPSCSKIQELSPKEDIEEVNIEEYIKQTEDLASKCNSEFGKNVVRPGRA